MRSYHMLLKAHHPQISLADCKTASKAQRTLYLGCKMKFLGAWLTVELSWLILWVGLETGRGYPYCSCRLAGA